MYMAEQLRLLGEIMASGQVEYHWLWPIWGLTSEHMCERFAKPSCYYMMCINQ